MDLRSALSAVADQIKTKPATSFKKKNFSKKKKNHAAKKEEQQQKSDDSPSHRLSSGEEEDKIRSRVIHNLNSSKRAYKELLEIKKYYDDHVNTLEEGEAFVKQATEFITIIKTKLESVTRSAGIRADLKRSLNECNSLLDGIDSEDITLSKELTLETLDPLIAIVKNWIRIYSKKQNDIDDVLENAERVSIMLQNNNFKKLSEDSFSEDFDKKLVTGYAVLPLGSFSAKLLEKYLKADASGGYPILPNQSFYVVNFKNVDRKTFDLEEDLKALSTESVKYALVSKKPKLYNGYVVYWIMTYHQLDLLKRSAAYQDYMMLKDWNYL